jgi:hypothetical protein
VLERLRQTGSEFKGLHSKILSQKKKKKRKGLFDRIKNFLA